MQNEEHQILSGGHPSPNADGHYFFYRDYFTGTNLWLEQAERMEIEWNLVNWSDSYPKCVWGWDSETKTSYCQDECSSQACLEDDTCPWR